VLRPGRDNPVRVGRKVGGRSGGGLHTRPARVVHRFSNPSKKPARFLGLIVPGGFATYWEELGEMMASDQSWPPADMGPVLPLMAKYDTFPPSHRPVMEVDKLTRDDVGHNELCRARSR
jgi:hypothetical protein